MNVFFSGAKPKTRGGNYTLYISTALFPRVFGVFLISVNGRVHPV